MSDQKQIEAAMREKAEFIGCSSCTAREEARDDLDEFIREQGPDFAALVTIDGLTAERDAALQAVTARNADYESLNADLERINLTGGAELAAALQAVSERDELLRQLLIGSEIEFSDVMGRKRWWVTDLLFGHGTEVTSEQAALLASILNGGK